MPSTKLKTTIRFPDAMKRALEELSQAQGAPINFHVVAAVRDYLTRKDVKAYLRKRVP
jgi:predicted transcriptional regulator